MVAEATVSTQNRDRLFELFQFFYAGIRQRKKSGYGSTIFVCGFSLA